MKSGPITVLIPAAGASRRLGRPKQLEVINGTSLLRAAVVRAVASQVGPVVVVLGHQADACRAELSGLDCETVLAPDWEEGMGATIRAGMAAVDAKSCAVLITLVDQWKLTTADLATLTDAWRISSLPMCAAAYGGTVGPPAVFGRECFPELLALSGDEGARRLLRAAPENVLMLFMPHAEADWDAPAT